MGGEVDKPIEVSDAAFEYLKLQKGSLDRFASNRALWLKAYRDDLDATYKECAPFLPPACWGILDIGSGLGGIDILLARHYVRAGHRQPWVNLLDGEDDPPVVKLHRETFNSMRVAHDFQRENGIRGDQFAYYTPSSPSLPKPYDLVVSFGSWCFHYAPAVYLPLLLRGGGLHRDTVVIVDVRKDKVEYWQQLHEHFAVVGVIREARKYDRVALKRQWK